MKYLIGFFFGLTVAAAMAADPAILGNYMNAMEATMAAGVGPDGKMAQIRVDGDGHVICSTETR